MSTTPSTTTRQENIEAAEASLHHQMREQVLRHQWQQDQSLRDLAPNNAAWRGCLGLAAMLGDADACFEHDGRVLYDNANVAWLVNRDFPRRQFPGAAHLNSREVNMASVVTARISRNVPTLDFTRAEHSWDFRAEPYDVEKSGVTSDTLRPSEFGREFAVLNLISQKMTEFAFCAVDRYGNPIRRAWAANCPEGLAPFMPSTPASNMPRPYLGFSAKQADGLFWASTEHGSSEVISCPECGVDKLLDDIKNRRFFEDGDFVGTCADCGVERKYHVEHAHASKDQRRFNNNFRYGFCRDLARGLPIVAPTTLTYLRVEQDEDTGLVNHVFFNHLDQETLTLPLLRQVRVKVKIGQQIEAGERIAHAVPSRVPDYWARQKLEDRWKTIARAVGSTELVPYFLHLWFEFQAFQVENRPGVWFWPAGLVDGAFPSIQSHSMLWDFTPCAEFIHGTTEAVIFPPIRLNFWNALQVNAGQIDIIADFKDPRLRGKSTANTRNRRRSRRKRQAAKQSS